jgi:GNAT superfamily N-acetyltransferase
MIKLRFATENDVAVILGLIKALAEFEKLSHEVVADEDTIRKNLFTERRSAEVVLAEKNGEAIGCAIFFHNFSTFLGRPGLYLEDLFVKPEYRNEGVGRLLLENLAQIAIQRDCGRMEWSVLDWNEKAIRFYKNLGAEPMNEWTVFRLKGQALENLAKKSTRRDD